MERIVFFVIVLCIYPFYENGVLTPKQTRGIIIDDSIDDFWLVDFGMSIKGNDENQEVISVPANDCLYENR